MCLEEVRLAPPPYHVGLTPPVLSSSLPLLPAFSPYETIACLHTLARCGIPPPMPWLQPVMERAYGQVGETGREGEREGGSPFPPVMERA